MANPTRRVLTGVRPTGPLHLGHYVGALAQWLRLQNEGWDCYFLIADIQALTTHVDKPALIEESVREVVLDFLAVGLDPTRPNVHFELQSQVPELYELTVLLTMLSRFGEMLSNPTIKEEMRQYSKSGKAADEMSAGELIEAMHKMSTGFMYYPDSQAADIFGVTPLPFVGGNVLAVAVGEDQRPHLEHANRLARRVREKYGAAVFTPCTIMVEGRGTLVGTDGDAKMSKSLGNAIYLKDDAATVAEKVQGMFTDKTKQRKGDPGHPETCPVYMYHQAFGDPTTLEDRAARCRSGELGCSQCKKELTATLNAFLDPIRARRAEAEQSAPIGKYLRDGSDAARALAAETIREVRQAMHLDYPSIFGS